MLKIQLITLAVCLSLCSSVVRARDVSAQQAGVEYARQQVEKADAQLKSDLSDVDDAEKLLEQRRKAFEQQSKRLADDRKKAALSKKNLQEANVKHAKAQAILDQAWKE
jgi:membrane-bound lytic murein transglycosylase B